MQSNFIGRKALEKQAQEGIKKKLVGLVVEGRAIARKGQRIINNTNSIGQITSGSWSPTLKKAIALAYIPKDLSQIGTQLNIEIRGKAIPAKVVKKPFYRRNV